MTSTWRVAQRIAAILLLLPIAQGADWPQLQNGPRRQGYSAEKIDLPLERAWVRGMAPERLHPQAQPVVAEGRLFIGTAQGVFRGIEARTGKDLWSFRAEGPILHTAGAEGGRVFFASLDGCVYALNAADGTLAWKFDSGSRAGFSTAVLLAEGHVFAASRDGACFALSQKDGALLWRRDLEAPVLMSSAYDEGRVFVCAMDMKMRALDAKTGQVVWTSGTLYGAAFKDYWPVVYKDYVLVRPLRASARRHEVPIEWLTGPLPEAELSKQDAMIEKYEQDPKTRNLFVLDKRTGKEPFAVAHWTTDTMNGATIPPCVDGDGLLIVPTTIHEWMAGWGRLNLEKRKVVEVLTEEAFDESRKNWKAGLGNSDENMTVSAANRLVLTFHTQEGNAHYTGVWHLDRRRWTQVGWLHAADAFFTSNTQGGGGNPPAISGGMVFHTSQNSINARTASVAP